jgi:thioredoxin reductase (NADPH)
MAANRSVRLAIIGSGPAGYTAAIYAARALLKPVLISGKDPGGQLTITTDVENYPGFAEAVQGPWLMDQMRAQAAHVGTEFVDDIVVSADLKSQPARLTLDSGEVILAESVIIATGAQAKWLGLPSEQLFQGFGVSACATCDGFFYRNKAVAVVGGGNSAVEEALYLATLASSVTVIHRRDSFRAEPILQERLFAHPKIKVVWNHTVEEIVGDATVAPGALGPAGVTGLRIRDTASGATETLNADGVFVAIGHAPASEVFRGQLRMSKTGYIKVKAGTVQTSLPGVFACGDVTDETYRQAVTAAGMGCMAALDAARFLTHKDHLASQSSEKTAVSAA